MLGEVARINKANLPWAAGLIVGEGSIGVAYSRKYPYLAVQLSMMDKRAVRRFAETFEVAMQRYYLKHRKYFMYKIMLRGRPAERAVSAMWPWLKNTDKGDQALRAARKLRIGAWITGKRRGIRPVQGRLQFA